MTDTCTVKRETGTSTNTTTGVITPTYAQIYSGPCRLQDARATARPEDAGEARRLMVHRELQLPVTTSTGILADDIVTIVTCINDPDMVGKIFRIREEAGKSEASSRRLGIEGMTS